MIREINGKAYEFEFTRRVIAEAEKKGFALSENKPASMAYDLWAIGLEKNQKLSAMQAKDLFDDYLDDPNCPENFNDVVESLVSQYVEVFG